MVCEEGGRVCRVWCVRREGECVGCGYEEGECVGVVCEEGECVGCGV